MRMRIARSRSQEQEDTRKVNAKATAQTVEVTADDEGLISHAGAFLLTELADRLGLTKALSAAMAPTRERRSAHDPGRVLRDLVVSIGEGAGEGASLGGRRAPRSDHPRHRRHPARRPFREGVRRRHLQARLRLSPA